LPIKNTLTSSDARLIETAFAFRISAFREGTSDAEQPQSAPAGAAQAGSESVETGFQALPPDARVLSSGGIDKSVLAFGEMRRLRDKGHLKYVASRSCLICGRQPSEPHHVRFAQKPAFGRKVSDEFTVPLCRLHHRELHRSRNELLWWKKARIDPIRIARELWGATRSKAAPRPAPEASGLGEGAAPNLQAPSKETSNAGATKCRPPPGPTAEASRT